MVAIGISFGANAGYAINPARDFGPRLFAWIAGWKDIAMPGNYGNVNTYIWIPIVGPFVGACVGAAVYDCLIRNVLAAASSRTRRSRRADRNLSHGGLHRRDRPGHDELALHRLRQGRRRSSPSDQREHEQITPKAGWVEHDAEGDLARTREVIGGALANSDLEAGDVAAIGITNQRETTVVWDRETGEPVYNAIVWQDTRTDAIVRELRRRRPAARGHRACRCRPTSPARRSSGSSTTSTARASAPRTASWRSGRWTPGCCGTSPAASTSTDVTNASAARC